MQLRRRMLSGFLLTSILVGIGLFLGQSYLRSERAAYERGAALAALHFSCRGTFPSAAYLGRTFSLGAPKTCADLDMREDRGDLEAGVPPDSAGRR
jgi:hypothetical protein